MKNCIKSGLFIIAILYYSTVISQDTDDYDIGSKITEGISSVNITPLTIGDEVPNIEFEMVNYERGAAKLSDFKGKLIILSFWATWCKPCLSRFPALDSLQKKYKDKLQIILVNSKVTKDKRENIIEIFNKNRNRNNGEIYQLPSAVEDVSANSLFPHKSIPHYIWITADQKVKAITSLKEVNANNIELILNKEIFEIPIKEDFDSKRLLEIPDQFIIDENFARYCFFKKGKMQGRKLNKTRSTKESNDKYSFKGQAMRNVTLLEMFETAIRFNSDFGGRYTSKRLIIETKDSLQLFFDSSKVSKDVWEKENLYTYDMVVSPGSSKKLYEQLIDDLNKYSNYYGSVEARKVKCLVIVSNPNLNKLSSSQLKNPINNFSKAIPLSVQTITEKLNNSKAFKCPIINKSNSKKKLTIQLPKDANEIDQFSLDLRKYGLELVEMEQELDMFVIKEKLIP